MQYEMLPFREFSKRLIPRLYENFQRIAQAINANDKAIRVLDADLSALQNPPCARVYHSAVQSIPNNSWTALAFNSERYDSANLHDPTTNNSRLTFGTAGRYLVGAHVVFAANATGQRGIALRRNGGEYIAVSIRNAVWAGETAMTISTVYDFVAGDYVEVLVSQNSGAALDVTVNPNYSPEFWAIKL